MKTIDGKVDLTIADKQVIGTLAWYCNLHNAQCEGCLFNEDGTDCPMVVADRHPRKKWKRSKKKWN